MSYEEYVTNYPGGEEAIIAKCRLYGMDDDVPKKTRITVTACVIAFIFIGGAVFAGVTGNKNLVLLMIIGGIIFAFAYIIKKAQFDTMKRFTKIMRDETGYCYKMKFTKGCNIMIPIEVNSPAAALPIVGDVLQVAETFKAMNKKDGMLNVIAASLAEVRTAYYYLKRYKTGYRDWDVMNGGDCKITPLGILTPIGKNKYRAEIMGKVRTVRIPSYLNYGND